MLLGGTLFLCQLSRSPVQGEGGLGDSVTKNHDRNPLILPTQPRVHKNGVAREWMLSSLLGTP